MVERVVDQLNVLSFSLCTMPKHSGGEWSLVRMRRTSLIHIGARRETDFFSFSSQFFSIALFGNGLIWSFRDSESVLRVSRRTHSISR